MPDNADGPAEDRPDRPEVPGADRERDGKPHGEHDDDHRRIGAEMQAHRGPRGVLAGGDAAWVGAAQTGHRQVGDDLP